MKNAVISTGRSRGFTLVEMSIVLVIIGLIIGGILKGQEIIQSAREKAVVNEINAVRSATNTYFDRYRALPGDDPNAAARVSANIVDGDGNGIVGAAAVATPALIASTVANTLENYQFFNALMQTGLLNGGTPTPAATVTGTAFGSSALPAAPLTGSGLEVIYGDHTGFGAATSTDETQLWLKIIKNPGAPAVAIAPHTLSDIDVVSDDGNPDSGGARGDDTATCETGPGTAAALYALQDQPGCVGIFAVLQ